MLKIFLMTKNEFPAIEDWIKYHGYLFGLDNIYVLDGSDDKNTLAVYEKYKSLGLNVNHSSVGLNDAAEELNKLMHRYKGVDNFLIKLDTDEFIAYTDPFILTPGNYLERFFRKVSLASKNNMWPILKKIFDKITGMKHGQKILYLDNLNEKLKMLPVTGQKYKASLTAWSLPAQEELPRPFYDLTDFTAIQYAQLKSFFHSSNFVSVDLGCHNGVTKLNFGAIDTGLTIIHFHSTSVEDSAKRAKQALLSHGYFDVSDGYIEQKEKLLDIRASGRVASYHKIDFYLQYLAFLDGGKCMPPSTLNLYHPYFRATGKNREINIIKDTLDYIDESGQFIIDP